MLFTHWSAAFCSPQQHERASSADRFTVVHDQSVIKLRVGRLRGRWRNHLWTRKLWNDRLRRFSKHADALDLGVNALLLVPVCRPKHWGLRHSRVLHSVDEVGDPTSLVLIAPPVQCSPTIMGSAVVVVRALKVR